MLRMLKMHMNDKDYKETRDACECKEYKEDKRI